MTELTSFDVVGWGAETTRSLWSDHAIEALRTRLVRKAARHGRPQDAEDTAQETLCRAFARRSELERERVGGWLTVVAKNVATDRRRAEARLNDLRSRLLHLHGPHDDHSDDVIDEILARQAVAAVESLPRMQREVLTSVASGNTIAEIACDKQLSTRSVEGHLRRARQSVRRWLSE